MRQTFAGALSLIEERPWSGLEPIQISVVRRRGRSPGRAILTFSTDMIPEKKLLPLTRLLRSPGKIAVSNGFANKFRIFSADWGTLLQNPREKPPGFDPSKRQVFMSFERELGDADLTLLKRMLAREKLVTKASYYLDVSIPTTARILRLLHGPESDGPALPPRNRAFIQTHFWRPCGIVDPTGVHLDGPSIRSLRMLAKETKHRDLVEIVDNPANVAVTFYTLKRKS